MHPGLGADGKKAEVDVAHSNKQLAAKFSFMATIIISFSSRKSLVC
jgi:hypothetical protein